MSNSKQRMVANSLNPTEPANINSTLQHGAWTRERLVSVCLSLSLHVCLSLSGEKRMTSSSKLMGFTEKKHGKSISRQLDVCSELQYVQVSDQLYTEPKLF